MATTTNTEHTIRPATSPGRRRRSLAMMAAAGAALALVPTSPAEAAPPARIDVTVSETLPVTTGSVLGSGFCAGGTVSTGPVSVTTRRDVTRFSGEKVFDCGSGDTVTISFRARVRGCADSNRGSWRVVDGTGEFEDARGRGRLVGTYVGGDACTASGVDDRYRGFVRL